MTAPYPSSETVTGLFRRHIREMRSYADQLAEVLGRDSPIVQRIRSCAATNEFALQAALDRYLERAKESVL